PVRPTDRKVVETYDPSTGAARRGRARLQQPGHRRNEIGANCDAGRCRTPDRHDFAALQDHAAFKKIGTVAGFGTEADFRAAVRRQDDEQRNRRCQSDRCKHRTRDQSRLHAPQLSSLSYFRLVPQELSSSSFGMAQETTSPKYGMTSGRGLSMFPDTSELTSLISPPLHGSFPCSRHPACTPNSSAPLMLEFWSTSFRPT